MNWFQDFRKIADVNRAIQVTRRRHPMPFGSEILPDGKVRFRLWAPSIDKVMLYWRSQYAESEIAMDVANDGWFEVETEVKDGVVDYGFRINPSLLLPDPASRSQARDVHGLSRLVDPTYWEWQDADWVGRSWEEAVIYELHIGTFTPSGDFKGVISKLDYLIELGVTAIQLMPVADFPGHYNWGYDGVLPFAPDSRYGSPDEFKLLVQTAHNKGLMVFLDVVYNHFGPEGNYLHCYAPQFFSERYQTPWGTAINFDAEDSLVVRQFFVHNALYWLEEYNLDGLRFDAVHGVFDESEKSIWEEIADVVYDGPGRIRLIHLMLENDNNSAHLLRSYAQSQAYTAQWNDDLHHALHVLLTKENQGYYGDYADAPLQQLGRCLTEGFAFQGEISAYRNGRTRGEPSDHLPPTAFIGFLQNHDQIGNRLDGKRLILLTSAPALRAATALLLLTPSPPLLFMGQEWGSMQPFYYFCDFEPELNDKVWQGRHQEFEKILGHPADHTLNPSLTATFNCCRLNWGDLDEAWHQFWLSLHSRLLKIRQTEIVPRLHGISGNQAQFKMLPDRAIQTEWQLGDNSQLTLIANFSDEKSEAIIFPPLGRPLYATHKMLLDTGWQDNLPPWSVGWYLQTLSEPS